MAMKHLNADGLLYLLQKLKIKFDTKVDKAEGKGLSSNDLTDELKQKILDAGDSSFSGNYNDLVGAPDLSSLHIHENKSTLDKVTDAKLAEWDSKQTAAQVETAIINKGYQTAAQVEATVTGKGYQTAAQVQEAVNAAGHVTKEIVETLPAAADAKDNVIYLMLKASGTEGDIYDEYMKVGDKLEKIGDTQTDLAGYLKEADLVAITNAEIDTIWNTVFAAA